MACSWDATNATDLQQRRNSAFGNANMTDAISGGFSPSYPPTPYPAPTPTPPAITTGDYEDPIPRPEIGEFDWESPTPDEALWQGPSPVPCPTPFPLLPPSIQLERQAMDFDLDATLPVAQAAAAVYELQPIDNYTIDPSFTANDSGTGFRAQLYRPVDGGPAILAFAGTDMKSPLDWITNLWQGLGGIPDQYSQALELTQRVRAELGDNVILAGHSLGGGLASYAGMETGSKVVGFNAAGLSWRTQMSLWWNNKNENADRVTQFRIRNEILSSETLLPIPSAPRQPGRTVELEPQVAEPAISGNPLRLPFELLSRLPQRGSNHTMSEVIKALEAARDANRTLVN